jgi:hypothetical protein
VSAWQYSTLASIAIVAIAAVAMVPLVMDEPEDPFRDVPVSSVDIVKPPTVEHEQPVEEVHMIEDVLVAAGNRELIGHDQYIDQRGMVMMYESVHGKKVKSYISHSRIDRTLQEIGYFQNFRLIGEHLIADFYFFDFAVKHYEYQVDALKEMVKTMPKEFGVSVVVYMKTVYIFEDGTEIPVKSGQKIKSDHLKYPHPIVRPRAVESFDWVRNGALTSPEGVFVK